MNIKVNRPLVEGQLIETSQNNPNGALEVQNFVGVDTKKLNKQQLQTILTVKSKQFRFDCGAIMADIRQQIDNPFSLFYYAQNASDAEDFVNKVRKTIECTGEKLTQSDETRLKAQYEKFIK